MMTDHSTPQMRNAATRTNAELLHLARTEADEEVMWQAITELQRRGNRDIFDQACRLCISTETHDRWVGADILAQLGLGTHPFHEEALVLLLERLDREQEPEVLYSIAVALGHRNDPRAIAPLVRLKNHPDAGVRFGVVFGLSFHEDELAILTLVELSADSDSDVRDWATFGLGSQIEADTPAIREALVARMADEDDDIRGEAMVGLAHRHDQRIVKPLLADLEAGYSGRLVMEATVQIGDPRLYPALLRLQEAWEGDKDDWRYQELEEAIERCRPAQVE